MISLGYILDFFKNNNGSVILLIALTVIISAELFVYLQSLRYIFLGALLSGLVFIGLSVLFYGYSNNYLYSALVLIAVVIILLFGTFIISFLIFLLYLFDTMIVMIIYFKASIYSIWTWIIAIAVSIVIYFAIKSLDKYLKNKLFTLDSEIKEKRRIDKNVRDRNKIQD